MTDIRATYLISPIGLLRIAGTDRGVSEVGFVEERAEETGVAYAHLVAAKRQLEEYFLGQRQRFDDLPLILEGADFRLSVWDAIAGIPYGSVATYAEIAKRVASPEAVRAVGTACGKNRLGIIIPCHRIVPSSGGIGEYGWRPDRKEWLLAHEKRAAME